MKIEFNKCKFASARKGKPICHACSEAFCLKQSEEAKKCPFYKLKSEDKK